jgi:hypothetical protein
MQARKFYIIGKDLDLLGFSQSVPQRVLERLFPSDDILTGFFFKEDAQKHADSFVNDVDLSRVRPVFTVLMSIERMPTIKSADVKNCLISRGSINQVQSVEISSIDRTSALSYYPGLSNLKTMMAGEKPRFQFQGLSYSINKKPFQLGLLKPTQPCEQVWHETKDTPAGKTIAVLKDYRYWFFAPVRSHRVEAATIIRKIMDAKCDNFQIFPLIKQEITVHFQNQFGAVLQTLLEKTAPESLTLEYLETLFQIKPVAEMISGYLGPLENPEKQACR